MAFQNQYLRITVGQFVDMSRIVQTGATTLNKFSVGMFVLDYTPDNQLQLYQVGVEPAYSNGHLSSVAIRKYGA